jgi:hypothetical protein
MIECTFWVSSAGIASRNFTSNLGLSPGFIGSMWQAAQIREASMLVPWKNILLKGCTLTAASLSRIKSRRNI